MKVCVLELGIKTAKSRVENLSFLLGSDSYCSFERSNALHWTMFVKIHWTTLHFLFLTQSLQWVQKDYQKNVPLRLPGVKNVTFITCSTAMFWRIILKSWKTKINQKVTYILNELWTAMQKDVIQKYFKQVSDFSEEYKI